MLGGDPGNAMSNVRFGLMLMTAFVLTYVCVWLGMKNQPMMAARNAPAVVTAGAPPVEPQIQTQTQNDPPARSEQRQAKVIEVQPPVTAAPVTPAAPVIEAPRRDSDRGRDRMRLTALEAASAY